MWKLKFKVDKYFDPSHPILLLRLLVDKIIFEYSCILIPTQINNFVAPIIDAHLLLLGLNFFSLNQ